ncbi:MAG: hypothetical protein LBH00_03450 [Planctomycetaceae bacterium]|jgi:hypothetical protein|nr:hypothetical protein [Planctomycetaceae bacterium]
MPIRVVCPGCLKRFQVSDRFAGKTGPCPNCETTIAIPLVSVVIQEDGDAAKNVKLPAEKMPIPRLSSDVDPIKAGRLALAVLGIVLLTFLLGMIPMPMVLRSFLGIIGLSAVSFPLVFAGYHILKDREQLLVFTESGLLRQTGLTAAGYVLIWLVFEYFLSASRADVFLGWFYFIIFAYLASFFSEEMLQIPSVPAFFHFCFFGFSVMLLRYCIGLGWFWIPNEFIRHSAAPPPPVFY